MSQEHKTKKIIYKEEDMDEGRSEKNISPKNS
jgi:hypothetical protein